VCAKLMGFRSASLMGSLLTENAPADDPPDLEWYRHTGHIVLEGRLGRLPVSVVITPYAQARMCRRDIDEAEVLQVLAHPPSSHGRGKIEGRFEAAGMTDRGRVRVVYDRPTRQVVLVITMYPETD
jgi:hypothetical protein